MNAPVQRSERFQTELLAKVQKNKPNPTAGETAIAHTPLSLEQTANALSTAWKSLHGEDPPEGLIPVLVGQVSLETGGGRGMLNYNFGGIKGTGPSGLSVRWRTTEGYGATERKIVDRFRAYRSAEEGATDYVRLLKSRFGSALERAQSGDAAGFVHELKKAGYFTGDERVYTRAVASVAAKFRNTDAESTTAASSAFANAAPLNPVRATAAPSATATTPQISIDRTQESVRGEVPEELAWISVMTAMSVADEIAQAAIRIAGDSDKHPRDNDTVLRALT